MGRGTCGPWANNSVSSAAPTAVECATCNHGNQKYSNSTTSSGGVVAVVSLVVCAHTAYPNSLVVGISIWIPLEVGVCTMCEHTQVCTDQGIIIEQLASEKESIFFFFENYNSCRHTRDGLLLKQHYKFQSHHLECAGTERTKTPKENEKRICTATKTEKQDTSCAPA